MGQQGLTPPIPPKTKGGSHCEAALCLCQNSEDGFGIWHRYTFEYPFGHIYVSIMIYSRSGRNGLYR